MADPISTASGLLALIVFAGQSSKLLYQAVDSFKSNKKIVRELREEVGALDGVLQSLQATASNTNADLAILNVPLRRCGEACVAFTAVIDKCTAHSGGPRTSFRDWAKLTYLGNDITGFKDTLAGYKSTIIIALADLNLRTTVISADLLKEYKEMITNTTSDLEDRLQEINGRLQTLSLQGPIISDEDATERERIRQERSSTQQCLDICAQVYTHIDQVQLTSIENISTPSGAYQGPDTPLDRIAPARTITTDTIKACKDNITSATTRLKSHLEELNNIQQSLSAPPANSSSDRAVEQQRIQEQIDGIKQCLAICDQNSLKASQERINIFEDIVMAEDGKQVIVSTIGDLISAKRVTAGAGSMQVLGQMSDDSVQHLSREHVRTLTEKSTKPQLGDRQFETRYGAGVKLDLVPPKDVAGGST